VAQGDFVVNSVGASPKVAIKCINDLLQLAVDAHGGLARRNRLKTVKANVSVTGAIWQVKGKGDALKDISIETELHKERLITHFNGQGLCTVFEPSRITLQTESGRLVDSRDDPRSAFRNHTPETPWGRHARGVFQQLCAVELLHHPFPLHLSRFHGGRTCSLGRKR